MLRAAAWIIPVGAAALVCYYRTVRRRVAKPRITVLVASEAPQKLEAVAKALGEAACIGCKAHSGVRDQPMGLDEITRGAHNRMAAALHSDASDNVTHVVAMENGLIQVAQGGAEEECVCYA